MQCLHCTALCAPPEISCAPVPLLLTSRMRSSGCDQLNPARCLVDSLWRYSISPLGPWFQLVLVCMLPFQLHQQRCPCQPLSYRNDCMPMLLCSTVGMACIALTQHGHCSALLNMALVLSVITPMITPNSHNPSSTQHSTAHQHSTSAQHISTACSIRPSQIQHIRCT